MRRGIILHSHENPDSEMVPITKTALVIPQQADSDPHLIELWLHGRSRHTQRAYRKDSERFLATVEKSLHEWHCRRPSRRMSARTMVWGGGDHCSMIGPVRGGLVVNEPSLV